jgi:hypothetical protein
MLGAFRFYADDPARADQEQIEIGRAAAQDAGRALRFELERRKA